MLNQISSHKLRLKKNNRQYDNMIFALKKKATA